MTDMTNPKDLLGMQKDLLSLVPPEGIRQIAKAMKNGADKYGAYNWRDKKVQYVIYLDAILRHTLALIDREDIAEDSQVHHLAHVGANVCILLDAIENDCLVDNRPKKATKEPRGTTVFEQFLEYAKASNQARGL